MDNPTGPTVGELLAPLVDVVDRGVHDETSFTPWRDHIAAGAALAAALEELVADYFGEGM